MEELLLDPLLVLEELDVVDQEDVVVAVALLEASTRLLAGELMKSFMNVSLVTYFAERSPVCSVTYAATA